MTTEARTFQVTVLLVALALVLTFVCALAFSPAGVSLARGFEVRAGREADSFRLEFRLQPPEGGEEAPGEPLTSIIEPRAGIIP
jgi:hypothetical protein